MTVIGKRKVILPLSLALGCALLVSPLAVGQEPPAGAPPPTIPAADCVSDDPDVKPMLVDLASALQLADAANPTIQLARQRILQAYADYLQARVLWLPNLQVIPVTYTRHDGGAQSFLNGSIIKNNIEGFIVPSAAAVLNYQVTDAYFAPLSLRQVARAQTEAARATTNDIQLSVALSYLDLLFAYGQLAINAETLTNATIMLNNAESAALAGKSSTAADVQRARTEVEVRKQERFDLKAQAATASAQLAQLLLLEPTVDLRPAEPTVVPIALVAEASDINELVGVALMNRPEMAQYRDLIEAARLNLKQARLRPLLPNISANYTTGAVAGGPEGYISQYTGFGNGTAIIYWQLNNLGIGNRAEILAKKSLYNQSNLQLVQVQAQVGAQITASVKNARLHARALTAGQEAVRQALEMWRRLRESSFGMSSGKYDPLGPLLAEQALAQARNQYLNEVIAYNRAQFQLYNALGRPALDALPKAEPVPVRFPAAPAVPVPYQERAPAADMLPAPRRLDQ
jgi:outer membrane protein TolC